MLRRTSRTSTDTAVLFRRTSLRGLNACSARTSPERVTVIEVDALEKQDASVRIYT